MKVLTKSFLYIATASILLISFGCKKKCDLGKDVISGEIVASALVVPDSGYLTENMSQDDYLINSSHQFANRFTVSFDGGVTHSAVNYGQYSIICYPTKVSCVAQFNRNVVINDVNETVKFTMKVTDCGKCDEDRYIENYYLIRAVPDHYTVLYDVDVNTVQ